MPFTGATESANATMREPGCEGLKVLRDDGNTACDHWGHGLRVNDFGTEVGQFKGF